MLSFTANLTSPTCMTTLITSSATGKLPIHVSTFYVRGQVSANRCVCLCMGVCMCVCRGSFRSSDKVHLREGQGAQFQRYHGDQIQTQPPGWWSPTRKAERAPLQDRNHARKSSPSGPIPSFTAVESFMEHKKELSLLYNSHYSREITWAHLDCAIYAWF